MSELLPCPFCGSPGVYGMYEGRHYVCCIATKCLTQPKTDDFNTRELSFEAWNTRNEWISVSERLPDDGQQILIYNGLTYYIDLFEDEAFLHDNYVEHMNIAGGNAKHVTHWMPLPAPPKGE